MASARCPVCEDIITIGIAVKLYQPVICPTCLANLNIVSLNPFELDIPSGSENLGFLRLSRPNHKRSLKLQKPRRISEQYEDDDIGDIDDYLLERSLRYKPEHENRRKSPKGG
jgi:hypothetical protein